MSVILSWIGDIRVVIGIAVVVVILSIWLCIEQAKYNGRQYEKNHVTHRYKGESKNDE